MRATADTHVDSSRVSAQIRDRKQSRRETAVVFGKLYKPNVWFLATTPFWLLSMQVLPACTTRGKGFGGSRRRIRCVVPVSLVPDSAVPTAASLACNRPHWHALKLCTPRVCVLSRKTATNQNRTNPRNILCPLLTANSKFAPDKVPKLLMAHLASTCDEMKSTNEWR